VKLQARNRIALAWSLWPSVLRGLPGGDPAAHARRGCRAALSLTFLLGYATIGLVTLRRPANRPAVGAVPTTVVR